MSLINYASACLATLLYSSINLMLFCMKQDYNLFSWVKFDISNWASKGWIYRFYIVSMSSIIVLTAAHWHSPVSVSIVFYYQHNCKLKHLKSLCLKIQWRSFFKTPEIYFNYLNYDEEVWWFVKAGVCFAIFSVQTNNAFITFVTWVCVLVLTEYGLRQSSFLCSYHGKITI